MKEFVNVRMEKKIVDPFLMLGWRAKHNANRLVKGGEGIALQFRSYSRKQLSTCFDNHHLGIQQVPTYRFLLNNSLKVSSHDDGSKESLKRRTKVTTC